MNDRIKNAFDTIRAEERLKAETREYIARKAYGRRTPGFCMRRWAAAAAAFLFFVLAGIGGGLLYFTPTSVISVDVNPSIELGVNRFDKVVSVKGYNEDGRALASSLHVRFLDYRDALDRLLKDTGLSKYVEEGQLVSVTVTGKSEKKSEEMLADVTSCTASVNENISCSCGNYEQMSAAHAAGMSFGKYKAYLELKSLDPEITEEDVRGLTMRQIRDMTDARSGSTKDTAESENQENRDAGNGQGNGYGCGNGHGRHHGGNRNNCWN